MSKSRTIAGIDVGTDKICTIIAAKSLETNNTNVIGVAASPATGLKKSQIVNLDEAIKGITQSVEAAERMAGYTINSAFVSISGAHIESLNSKGVVAVSEPEGEIIHTDVERVIEAARAVSMPNSREIIHVIPRDYVVDSQGGIKDPVGMSGVRLEAEGHLITGSQTSIRNLSKAISELGIQVDGIVFSGLASSFAVLSDTEKELGVVMVDIGGGTTSITAFVDGAIAHSSVIPVGAKNITNDLAIGMRISLADAEKIKIQLSDSSLEFAPPKEAKASEIAKLRKDFDTLDLQSLGIKDESATASKKALVEGIIRPRLVEIFSLVGERLKEAGIANSIPAGFVITGGGAKTVGVIEVAKRTLSLPARIGIPKGLNGLVDELASPEYATATGLVHYGLKNLHMTAPASGGFNFLGSIPKLPVRGAYDKVIDIIKSLLP
jgi:cell division protein FtsA